MPIKLHQVLGDDLKLARRSTSKRQRIDLLVSATLLWRCRPHVICWSCFLLPQSRDTSWANFRKDELKVLTTKKFRVNLFRCLLPFSWYIFLFINPYIYCWFLFFWINLEGLSYWLLFEAIWYLKCHWSNRNCYFTATLHYLHVYHC